MQAKHTKPALLADSESRRRTGRRDPRRRRTRHPSCLRRSLEHQTHWRAPGSWPPPQERAQHHQARSSSKPQANRKKQKQTKRTLSGIKMVWRSDRIPPHVASPVYVSCAQERTPTRGMPVTPGKTPISAVTTSEQRVGVQKKSDTDLLTTQLKYPKIMLDAKGISDKLYPCIS